MEKFDLQNRNFIIDVGGVKCSNMPISWNGHCGEMLKEGGETAREYSVDYYLKR